MPRFTLRQLEVFEAVARSGTISGAAQELVSSPSAVAGALTELERAVGVQLTVRRRSHGVTLTAAGRRFARSASALLHEANGLEMVASSDGDHELTGEVIIGCYVTLAPSVLPPVLQGLERTHPGIRPKFIVGDQNQLQTAALRGEIDVALLYDMGLHEELDSRLVVRRSVYAMFAEDEAPPTRQGDPEGTVRLSDVAQRDHILFDVPPSREHTLEVFAAASVRPRTRFRTNDVELTRSLVARGMGYTLLAQRFTHNVSNEGRPLQTREIYPPTPTIAVHIAWPRDVRPRPAAQALIELTLGELRGSLV
ncbi:LysR substrate-binding domain-containing protein [Nesterenkonia rhizosphaerae]|uniref:LysR family transcriptional regulator n=1 Tax=Nesterenkonia rhizosphaerae TaxID=1348272 RepID=A0ABP9FP81_9MICC